MKKTEVYYDVTVTEEGCAYQWMTCRFKETAEQERDKVNASGGHANVIERRVTTETKEIENDTSGISR
jgi:hypothetical protein